MSVKSDWQSYDKSKRKSDLQWLTGILVEVQLSLKTGMVHVYSIHAFCNLINLMLNTQHVF
jgi:hypothetical protein